jgi:predicted AlkP superfamily phosphohydrolase/phosphomutase
MRRTFAPALLLSLSLGCASEPAPAPRPASRVFLIGIDGATWDRLEPLIETGRLKAFNTLLRDGVRAPLQSMLPTVSPALWTTVATGKTFEKHGINDFTYAAGDEGERSAAIMHMTSNMRRTKALWNIMGDVGRRSAFVGWWVSWPAEPVNGYIVSSHVPLQQSGGRSAPTKGTLAPDLEGQTWPPELFGEIAPLIRPADGVTFDEASRFMMIDADEIGRDIVEGFRWAYSADETYRAVTKRLLEKDPDIELWGIYFNGIDVVEHRYWKYNEPDAYRPFDREEIPRFRNVIDRYYKYTDELIWDLLEQRREGDTFLVISDHGFHARGHKDAPSGVFVAEGRHIAPGAVPKDPRLVDIAPTVLALLGIPAAEDMDGRVMDELFTEEWRAASPRERIPTYDTEGWREQTPIASSVDEELMERLRGLGYVE